MNKNYYLSLIILIQSQLFFSQVTLTADGPGNTYELINSVLANPGRNVIEAPDCSHPDFGRHIDEIFDRDLNKFVFRFHIHIAEDNDRCLVFVKQRNEIKSFSGSPNTLKATYGESVEYTWKFKLSEDFNPSSRFTHIHQIKSVGDGVESSPLFTLTLRKRDPNRFEIRYTPFDKQTTLDTGELSLLKGKWISAKQIIKYSDTGSYYIELKDENSGTLLFSYKNEDIDTWQENADFARPKWGIYRGLIEDQGLKDEEVLFADFSINEFTISELPINESFNYTKGVKLVEDNASSGFGSWFVSNPRTGSDIFISDSPTWSSLVGITPPTGNAIRFKGSGVKPELLFTPQIDNFGKIYMSTLLKVTDVSDITTTPTRFLAFANLNDSGSVSSATSIYLKSDGNGGYNLGVNESSSKNGIIWEDTNYAENQELMLVAYFDDGTIGETTAKLWINPTINGDEPEATLIDDKIRNQNVDRVQIYQHSNATTPEMILDELRIGKTWSSVTENK